MIFEQFYLSCLAHASYLIGSDGVGAVVDPQRDVEIYLDAARERGLHIRHVIETHLHADFVSGHRELAELTGRHDLFGGRLWGGVSPCFGTRWGRGDGGAVPVAFLQTPGHTPESVCIVIHDPEHGEDPYGVLTGDTLFIGDVGRPDLSATHTPQELAGLLYDSLHEKVLTLPDSTLVYPAHGAGSMCGRNISTDRNSTIGRERQFNYALRPMAREQFVELMTTDLPVRPEYFAKDVELNRHGAEALIALPPIVPFSPEEAEEQARQGVVILDTRSASDFCAAHIPGSINVGLSGQFASWAGSVIGLERRILVVAEDLHSAEQARLRLARVGLSTSWVTCAAGSMNGCRVDGRWNRFRR